MSIFLGSKRPKSASLGFFCNVYRISALFSLAYNLLSLPDSLRVEYSGAVSVVDLLLASRAGTKNESVSLPFDFLLLVYDYVIETDLDSIF